MPVDTTSVVVPLCCPPSQAGTLSLKFPFPDGSGSGLAISCWDPLQVGEDARHHCLLSRHWSMGSPRSSASRARPGACGSVEAVQPLLLGPRVRK